MRTRRATWMTVAGSFALIAGGILTLHLLLDRTREFKACAVTGQSIVRAIERFQQQTGTYPACLADLVPHYLPSAPEQPDRANHKYTGWDYVLMTNAGVVAYRLGCYLGRGGVDYEPPNWVGNDEGRKQVILSNE